MACFAIRHEKPGKFYLKKNEEGRKRIPTKAFIQKISFVCSKFIPAPEYLHSQTVYLQGCMK